MGPVEIVVIIAAIAIVLGVVIAAIVRKAKGKPSLSSDCCGCPYADKCQSCHGCSAQDDSQNKSEQNRT